MEALDHYHS